GRRSLRHPLPRQRAVEDQAEALLLTPHRRPGRRPRGRGGVGVLPVSRRSRRVTARLPAGDGPGSARVQSRLVPRLPVLVRLGLAARRGVGRFTPDPFVVAVLITLLTLACGGLALGGGLSGLLAAIRLWS